MGALVVVGLLVPASALAHPERPSFYPNFNPSTGTFGPHIGSVPRYRTTGPAIVVCKPDSERRLRHIFGSRSAEFRVRQALFRQCRFNHIQEAVNAAGNDTRILVLPGEYREEPSRAAPNNDPRCREMTTDSPDVVRHAGEQVPTYEYQFNCPNDQNLIAILGDGPDQDIRCDRKCNLQIEGMGKHPLDVVLNGERNKFNLIRADRADGIYLRNFTAQFSDFNNLYALETNGFVFDRIISRWSREYGFLSFASDQGLYTDLETYGAGDSGIYPGSGPEWGCQGYGIEIRRTNSHHNNLGYSGTAGNGVWAHDNRFWANGAGLVTDSLVPGHPGMPQDCAKWERNYIYDNNTDFYDEKRTRHCQPPPQQRDPHLTCSTFQHPTGSGLIIGGGNRNIVRDNYIWNNWRQGTWLVWVPSSIRNVDPTGQSTPPTNPYDTSYNNVHDGNRMGVRPDGTPDRNGTDFVWDGEGAGNCWSANTGPGGAAPTSNPSSLPPCPGSSTFSPGRGDQTLLEIDCFALWSPSDYGDYPPRCDWFSSGPNGRKLSDPGPGVPPPSGPDIRSLRMARTVLSVGSSGTAVTASRRGRSSATRGTSFSFFATEPGIVRIHFQRLEPGRRAGTLCIAQRQLRPGQRRCTALVAMGSILRRVQAGPRTIAFSGRRAGYPAFRPGRYRAVLSLYPFVGPGVDLRSPLRFANFTIVR